MIRRPPRSTLSSSSAASDVYKRQTSYGDDMHLEKVFIHPEEPLVFFNIQGIPDATCLPWEHTLDKNGKPCSNPRIVVPRRVVANVVNEPEEVDVRTFGVRMPACTRTHPSYGIMGMMHIVPPALAWIWRLIAPRGDKNPSIGENASAESCLLYTSDAADEEDSVDLGGRRII